MTRLPTAQEIAASLKIRERVVLLCIARGGTEWQRLGIAGDAMATMAMKGLIDCDARRPSLTADGRAVVAAMETQVSNFEARRDCTMVERQLADERAIPSPAH